MFDDVTQINCVKRFLRQSELAPVTPQSSRRHALDALRIEFNPFNFPAALLHLLQHRTVSTSNLEKPCPARRRGKKHRVVRDSIDPGGMQKSERRKNTPPDGADALAIF